MKILVVEDEKKVANLLKRGLADEDYTVTVSHDGVDGLKQALSGDFNLLVLDVSLPKKDGVAVVKELRARQAFKKPSIARREVIIKAVYKQHLQAQEEEI